MMKTYLYIVAVSILLPLLMSCQSVKKARKQMDKYNYTKAIELLKKDGEKGKQHDAALPLLAECYRMQHDVLNARSAYAKVVSLPDAKPESFLYYAQALQSTGNYTKAREMFQLYSEKNPSDVKAKRFVAECDSVLGPWKGKTSEYEVKPAKNINTGQSEFGPAFYEGQLVFASDFRQNPAEGKKYGWTGHGYLNIMKSSPEDKDDFWGNMQAATSFDSKFNLSYHDGPAAFSSDGNSIYFTRSFYGKAKREGLYKTNLLKIYYASKTDGKWGDAKPFFLNSKDYSVGHPTLSADGQTLYFVSDMPGGQGGTDIWKCEREGDTWGAPVNLGTTLNTSGNEMFPTMRADGVLFFASDGLPGYGALDIFSTRKENGSWTTPVNLHPPINGSFDDFAIAFAPGAKNGFFSSNRLVGVGSDDIYAFRMAETPAPVLPAYITGVVKDKTTMKPIDGAIVFLLNPSTGNVKILKTGIDGVYKTVIGKPDDYVIKAMMPNHIADCIPFTMTVIIPGTTTKVPDELVLDKLVINKTFRIENIYYNFDKYNIREDAKVELDKLVTIMNENAIDVELGSHTDSRGSFTYNDKLSQNRAESVVKYIVGAGIDKNRITAKGYGEHQLTNRCADGVDCTPEEHQANRRTEFKVTGFTTADTRQEYDLSKFTAEDIIPVYMFDQNFFANCLRNVVVEKPKTNTSSIIISAPVQNKVQAESEKKLEKTKIKTKPDVIIYKVNLYALSVEKSLKDPEFKNLDNVQMYLEDGKYKYTSGAFSTYQEAEKYKNKLIRLGYEDAFIVTFSNGKRIKSSPY